MVCLFFVPGKPLSAAVSDREPGETEKLKKLFPTPANVKKQVRFWEKIFYKYPSSTVIVHDVYDLGRIVDVIDYKNKVKADSGRPMPRKDREEVSRRYLKRYTTALERFAKEKELAVRHGAIEKRVFKVFSRDKQALQNLYDGNVKLRVQTGLADDFVLAAARAQNYLPYMEQIFDQYGVPKQVTRLAFVESMFNLKARSKVGASGIWQFMPETARNYIYVTSVVDERNSPFKATRAAAQFLFENYRELKSWPLAITAYNHGRIGMANAVNQLASDDIGVIVDKYESRSFGFASRNFYAEFLAAVSTYERLQKEHKIETVAPLPDTVAMVLTNPLTVGDLARHTPLTKELIAEHNPCILETAFSAKKQKTLPEFYEIRIPRQLYQATKSSLDGLDRTKYARR
jgi:membrane-bound lytic murein transglycosylase D